MNCKNCGLPIAELLDPWGGQHGWYHPTIEREVNIDGADVMIPATFCPDDLGEAEPDLGLIGSSNIPYSEVL
jgi:hypothetical protein